MANNNDEVLGNEYIGASNTGGTATTGSTTETVNKQRFKTRIFHENNNQVIGAEVIIYDDDQNVIDTIEITDKTTLDKIKKDWEEVSNYYVLRGDVTLPDEIQALVDAGQPTLQSVLANPDNSTTINATSLNGTYTKDDFALKEHTHGDTYCVTKHDSSNKDYGVSTKDLYGHCKIADRLTDATVLDATALSSHQGYVLNQKITQLQKKNTWSSNKTLGKYITYRVNSDLRLMVLDYNRSDYTGLKKDTGVQELHKAGYIPSGYRPTSRVITPLYRGDVTFYVNKDGSINLYNLTKIKEINIHAQLMWYY